MGFNLYTNEELDSVWLYVLSIVCYRLKKKIKFPSGSKWFFWVSNRLPQSVNQILLLSIDLFIQKQGPQCIFNNNLCESLTVIITNHFLTYYVFLRNANTLIQSVLPAYLPIIICNKQSHSYKICQFFTVKATTLITTHSSLSYSTST